MCHLLPVHHLGMAFLAGSKVKIQRYDTWTLTKRMEKKLDSHCMRMLRANFKQVLEATSYKTTAVRTPTIPLENHPN